MKQSPLNRRPVTELIAEQVDCLVMDGTRHVVIACDTRHLPEGAIPDPNRGLLRKAADAIFNFIGYHRLGEPFRNRLRD